MTAAEFTNEYKGKIDYLDMEILIAHSLGKTREFVLIHPELEISNSKIEKLKLKIDRRAKGEPIAYLVGHKEFYGLDFIVNEHTLVPRPETELMVEQVLDLLRSMLRNTVVMDIGTGSGCIIISIANAIEQGTWNMEQKEIIKYFGTDISVGALNTAKKNAKLHNLNKQIKFLHGNLLSPIIETGKLSKLKTAQLIITANLPYLSKEIYDSAPVDVKKFEPKSALYSPKAGLAHYEKLLKQIQILLTANDKLSVAAFLEISPEQKQSLAKLIKSVFPSAKIEFTKDLAGKWRLCKVAL